LRLRKDERLLRLSDSDWDNLRDLINILEPLKSMTEAIESEKYPTISKLLPVFTQLEINCNAAGD
jgi:hypothetical protein